jgi:bifunctional non-homologous end joining protein LigD
MLHEIKHDGFRVIARKKGVQVKLYSRPGNDLTYRFPLIVEALAGLRSRSCIIDGEAAACDDNGVTSFNRVRYRRHDESIFLYAFDLIELNGDDLRRDPLEGRKATLEIIMAKAGPGIRFNEHMEGDGEIVFRHACKLGLEGIVSKRKDSPYRSGRSPDWLKMKNADAPAVKREAEEDWGREMAMTQGRLSFVFGIVVVATLLIAAQAAHATCKSPKSICKYLDDCLQRTSGPNNTSADDIRTGIKARNGHTVLVGAKACARDLGKKQQWDKWTRGCSELEFVQIGKVVLELGNAHCDRYSQ